MDFGATLRAKRRAAGLTQARLAGLTGIARPNVSAYEAGRREPLVGTATTLLAATGATLTVDAEPTWTWTSGLRPRPVPSTLWRLPAHLALRSFEAGIHLSWSGPPRVFDLADPTDRHRAYEVVLREGGPDDIRATVDGVLLCDAWERLVLPRDLRRAWQTVVDRERRPTAVEP